MSSSPNWGLPSPAYQFDVDTSSLGRTLGEILIKAEEAISAQRPDGVLVLGDTNSCIAALMARRMKVPVYHMEAGNRCFDLNVPEETNRKLIDHVADFNLVYTEHARRNLLAEGVHPRRILLTGSPMREVLSHYRGSIAASSVVNRLGVEPGKYFVASAHREENVDDPRRLVRLLDCLRALTATWGLPVLVSTHPRTRKRIQSLVADVDLDGVIFHEPFGFFDYVRLQMDARCVLSDSGTISEESAILGFPAVTLRDSIERPESLDAGTIIVTGLEPAGVIEAVETTVAQSHTRINVCASEYRIPDTSRRVVNFILSTIRRHHEWAGIRLPARERIMAEVVIDAAGGSIGGAARWAGELDNFLSSTDAPVRVIGRSRRLTPSWLARREPQARGATMTIAANNACFAFSGAHRRVLVNNALHFLYRGELDLLRGMPRSFRLQIPVVRRLLARADTIIVPSSTMRERVEHHVPSVRDRIAVRAYPVSPVGPRSGADEPFVLVPIVPAPYKNVVSQLPVLLDAIMKTGLDLRIQVTASPGDLPVRLSQHPLLTCLGVVAHDELANCGDQLPPSSFPALWSLSGFRWRKPECAACQCCHLTPRSPAR